MEQLKYERKNKTLFDLENRESRIFYSINQAKRESRKLQMANGGLGRGSLRVIK